LHDSGVHWEIVSGAQTGCVQFEPAAHAIAGQGGLMVDVSHEKPFGQSVFWAHVAAAQTLVGARRALDAISAASA
jgi:hypothetical protein